VGRAAICWALLLLPDWLSAQVVLSRRVYAEHGQSWQQLWISSQGYDNFKQVTRSPRNHDAAVCSHDGKQIFFTSDDRGDLNVGYAYSQESLWSFDRITGEERLLRKVPVSRLVLIGVTADGAPLILQAGNLARIGQNEWRIDKISSAALSPDGARIVVSREDQTAFITDSATGRSQLPIGRCLEASWSPGGSRIACIDAPDVVILDSGTLKEIERVRFSERDSAPEDPVWSPDERRLLVGTYGENAGSGDAQVDYFHLNLTSKTWTREMTAQHLLWLPGRETVLYIKPIELLPLPSAGKHSVWTSQLALFELATRKDTLLTSGLSNNIALGLCGK
jgi:hypothetical protein